MFQFCWVWSPIVETVDAQGPLRMPRVALIEDPARVLDYVDEDGSPRTVTKRLSFASWQCNAAETHCLCLVSGIDLSLLAADGQCEDMLETTYRQHPQWLDSSPKALGWASTRRERVRGRFRTKGATVDDVDDDQPLWRFLNRVARRAGPGFDARKTRLVTRWSSS